MLRHLTYYNPHRHHPTKLLADNVNPGFFERTPKRIVNDHKFDDIYTRIQPCNDLKCIRFPDLDLIGKSDCSIIHYLSWLTKDSILLYENTTKMPEKISDKYVSDPYYFYHRILGKLKTRACVPAAWERRKYRDIMENNFYDDYKDFLVFEAPDVEFLNALAVLIYMYNKESKHQFMPIFEILARRNAAACKIQACWRSYFIRKSYEIPLIVCAIRRRAVYCIQRWWRSIRFSLRMVLLGRLARYLASITTEVVYLEEHLY